jgi:hypothetical protein
MLGPGTYPYARTEEIGQTGLTQIIKIEPTLVLQMAESNPSWGYGQGNRI